MRNFRSRQQTRNNNISGVEQWKWPWSYLVKIIGTTPRDEGGDKNCDEAKGVLLPFNGRIVFAAAREEASFHNSADQS